MVEPLHDIHMAAARAWNTLPLDVRAAPSLAAFGEGSYCLCFMLHFLTTDTEWLVYSAPITVLTCLCLWHVCLQWIGRMHVVGSCSWFCGIIIIHLCSVFLVFLLLSDAQCCYSLFWLAVCMISHDRVGMPCSPISCFLMCCMALSISSQTCAHFSGLLELFYLPVVNSGPPLRGHVRITPYLYVCPSVCLSVCPVYLNMLTQRCADVLFNWRTPAAAMASSQQQVCCVSLCALSGRASIVSAINQADALVLFSSSGWVSRQWLISLFGLVLHWAESLRVLAGLKE